MPSFLDVSLKT